MLGWSITVRMAPSDTVAPGSGSAGAESILARWTCGVGGLDWLGPLLQSGAVRQTQHHGYPNTYRGRSADLLPLIEGGEAMRPRGIGVWVIGLDEGEEYAIPPGGIRSDLVVYADRISQCPADAWLTVEAWDQS